MMALNNPEKYICPMRDEGEKTYPVPGKCPVCGMKLVPYQVQEPGGEEGNNGRP